MVSMGKQTENKPEKTACNWDSKIANEICDIVQKMRENDNNPNLSNEIKKMNNALLRVELLEIAHKMVKMVH